MVKSTYLANSGKTDDFSIPILAKGVYFWIVWGAKMDAKRVAGRVWAIWEALEGLRAPPLAHYTERGAPYLAHFRAKNGQKNKQNISTENMALSCAPDHFWELFGKLFGSESGPGAASGVQTLVIAVYLKDFTTPERTNKWLWAGFWGPKTQRKTGRQKIRPKSAIETNLGSILGARNGQKLLKNQERF